MDRRWPAGGWRAAGQVVLLPASRGSASRAWSRRCARTVSAASAVPRRTPVRRGGGTTPLGPFVRARRMPGLRRRGGGSELDKLRGWSRRVRRSGRRRCAGRELLSTTTGVGRSLLISPQRRKEIALECVLDLIVAPAGHGPALLLVEDLHWADPTWGQLIGLLVGAGQRAAPMLVVATYARGVHAGLGGPGLGALAACHAAASGPARSGGERGAGSATWSAASRCRQRSPAS